MARRYWVKIDGRKHYVPGSLADLRRAAQNAANNLGRLVQAGYDERPARRTLRRNPMMGGRNFTGEEWLTAGFGPRGRLAMISNSRREAENDAAYLHSLGYRALTTRRTKGPVGAQDGRKARSATR